MGMKEIDRVLAAVEEEIDQMNDRAFILLQEGARIDPKELDARVQDEAAQRTMRAQLLGAGALIPGRLQPMFGLERG